MIGNLGIILAILLFLAFAKEFPWLWIVAGYLVSGAAAGWYYEHFKK